MSGKAPPKGPRALLGGSQGQGANAPSRVPPTGPRSLNRLNQHGELRHDRPAIHIHTKLPPPQPVSPPPPPPPPPVYSPPPPPPPPSSPPPEPPQPPPPIPHLHSPSPPPPPSPSPSPPPPPPPPPSFSWPPPPTAYPSEKNFKVLFDSLIDVPSSSHTRVVSYPPLRTNYHLFLISRIRNQLAQNAHSHDLADRIISKPLKSSAKEHLILLRHNGIVLDSSASPSSISSSDETLEPPLSPSDPRQNRMIRVPSSLRPPRSEFILLSYESDLPSSPLLPSSSNPKHASPPQPSAVLITHFNPLTPPNLLKHHLSSHGTILSLERPIDQASGGALDILWVKYASPEQAKRCMDRDTGRRDLAGFNPDQAHEWKIEYDDDGSAMKRILAERKKSQSQSQIKKPPTHTLPTRPHSSATPRHDSSSTPSSSTSNPNLPSTSLLARPPNLPPKPTTTTTSNSSPLNLGRSPHPNGSTPGTGTIASGSPHPSLASHTTLRTDRDRPTDRMANVIAIGRRNDAVEQSLRAAREAAGLLAASTSAGDLSQAQDASGLTTAVASTSTTGPDGADKSSASTTATTQATTTTTTKINKNKKTAFLWGTLSFGHLSRNAAGAGGKYTFPTKYAKYAVAEEADEDEKVQGKDTTAREMEDGKPRDKRKETKEAKLKKLAMLKELEKNGMEYVVLEASGRGERQDAQEGRGGDDDTLGMGGVSDEDLKGFFLGYRVDKILRDPTTSSIYITFHNSNHAHAAVQVLSTRQIGFRAVKMRVGQKIGKPEVESYEKEVEKIDEADGKETGEKGWGKEEMLDEGVKIIMGLLRSAVTEKVGAMVGEEVDRVLGEEKEARRSGLGVGGAGLGGLKGLSFKKKEPGVHLEQQEEEEEEEEEGKRPRKKQRVDDEDEGESEVEEVEGEPEEEEDVGAEIEEEPEQEQERKSSVRKRMRISEWLEESEAEAEDVAETVVDEIVKVRGKKGKTVKARKGKKQTQERKGRGRKKKDEVLADGEGEGEETDVGVLLDGEVPFEEEEEEVPQRADKKKKKPKPKKAKLPRARQTTISTRSPSPKRTPTPQPPALLDPFEEGLCEDDEDVWYVRIALGGPMGEGLRVEDVGEGEAAEKDTSADVVGAFDSVPASGGGDDVATSGSRKHLTGSARTEGFYKISHAEKAAYVSQYQTRSTAVTVSSSAVKGGGKDSMVKQHVESSRSNRANARRRAQGLDELNTLQMQRTGLVLTDLDASTTTTTEPSSLLLFKFNQLQTRKKHLRFARSPIHDWGLYAMEKIVRGEMVIEYVGEVVRAQVAEKREKVYERQGIGSSYLFRINEDLVVDATMKGNLGRLINHSCDPNCTAKIITIGGEKKIVIYAKQDIELGDEITYDYHFPFEQDKIPCLCGSAKCRGYLN